MQHWFHDVVSYLTDLLEEGQVFTCRLSAEESESVRVNGGRIRQCGSIDQKILALRLLRDDRQVAGQVTLTGSIAEDRFPLRSLYGRLAAMLSEVEPDPYLTYPVAVESSEDREENALPGIAEVLPEIAAASDGVDPVGHFMQGRIVQAFATSLGLRRWYETATYDLELSLCLEEDRAAKVFLGGTRWDVEELHRRIARARGHAERLRGDRIRLEPGRYRAYIAPGGWKALLQTVAGRGAFSLRATRNGSSPFAALHEDRKLDPTVEIHENHRLGWVCPFNSEGYRRPPQIGLVEQGQARSLLVSPRSGAEFDVPHTGSEASESPVSVEVAPGPLLDEDLLATIGDGLWLEHLHYLNLSDRATASITGLTRYAAFRVRDGQLAEPVEVARFDDSLLELLGERLVGFTQDRQRVPETRSYQQRSLGGALVPGGVVEGLRVVS